ncbi:MAG: cation:proton antiporter [Candidatus Uhrbacteria bacterium]|nr:cation:proton antiporter [Candidatus Uhrbacteria bacterium]
MLDILFLEIAAVIVTAGLVSLVIFRLRQPLIIAYIITGLLVGPSLFDLAKSPEIFEALAQVGIAFLLFLVGLNLDWRSIRHVGRISVLAGLGQIIFTTLFGFLIAGWLGFDVSTSLVLSIAFALSSTIVIIKLLSDKEDIERFYGRITIGILIVQDIVAMLVLLVLSAMSTGNFDLSNILLISVVKGAVVIALLWLLGRFVLPHLMRYAAGSSELLFLAALTWCFALASALHFAGFGIEIGALLAGVSLASTGFQREIGSKIRPLRDFFLIIFFIVLGTNLTLASFSDVLVPSIVFSVFVLVGNPIIVILILRIFGYHPRTGFLTGSALAQVSEFSFIIIVAAIAAGISNESVLSMATVVGLVTIGVSTYLIAYNEQLYDKLSWMFRWLERGHDNNGKKRSKPPEIIMFGYHRMGEVILPSIQKLNQDYVVVDFDPVAIEELNDLKIPCEYGDAASDDFLGFLRAEKSKLIISTIPDPSISSDILQYLKTHKSKASAVVTVRSAEDVVKMYEMGATFVIIPSVLGGELFSQILQKKKARKASWDSLAKKQKRAFGTL